MSRVELAAEIAEDIDRIISHLDQYEVADLPQRLHEINQAISVLAYNPQIGRLTDLDNRELVIGKASRGYIALYRYIEATDTVFVLAIRGQQEAGYVRI